MFLHFKICQGFWDLDIILSKGWDFLFVLFLAMPHDMWDLSSLTRDGT